jgi:hypothetical protein
MRVFPAGRRRGNAIELFRNVAGALGMLRGDFTRLQLIDDSSLKINQDCVYRGPFEDHLLNFNSGHVAHLSITRELKENANLSLPN